MRASLTTASESSIPSIYYSTYGVRILSLAAANTLLDGEVTYISNVLLFSITYIPAPA